MPAVQRTSKRLFGSRYALEIAACIADRQSAVNPTKLTEELAGFCSGKAPSHSSVVQQIRSLEDAGLLRLTQTGRETEYEIIKSVYFEMCRSLLDELSADPPT